MTILQGHFAMVVVVHAEVTPAEVEDELRSLSADGTLQVSVREIPYEDPATALGSTYLLSVHGADRPGIVATITGVVA